MNILSLFKPGLAAFQMPGWMRMRFRRARASGATPISRSKYKPHQGARECARRAARLQKGGR